jgi:hypothetical protein
MNRRMTKSAAVTPMHNITAAINAAEEKAGEVSRNFQKSASIAISTHANATDMNLCSWSAYALSRAVLTSTKIANKMSQDAAPRNSETGLGHRAKKATANPRETSPSTRRLTSFRLPAGVIGGVCVLSGEVLVRSSPLDFRHRISDLNAKNITHPELRT